MFDLRPFQKSAIQSLRQSLARGSRAPILVSPTGSGKTVMAAHIIKSAVDKGKRVLFLAPRRELIRQVSTTLFRSGINHGLIMAGEDLHGHLPVQVASWDTLRSWIKREKIHAPTVDLVLVDEAHLSLAQTYRRLLRKEYPNTAKIGLTATPARSDGKPLGAVYDDIVEAANVRELTEQGYLVPTRYFAPTTPDLEGLKVVRGDYETKGIEDRFNTPQIVGDVVYNWFRLAEGRQTVVFANTVAHAAHLMQRFTESGIAADYIHCKMDTRDREEVLRKVASGETRVICNVDILTFGWDMPPISCAVLARPTKSLVRYFQTVGRVLRPYDGKHDALVIDHGGVVDELGFVDDPVPWTLGGDTRIQDAKKAQKKNKAGPVTCGECGLVFDGRKDCPDCGWEPPQKVRALESYDGDLQEVGRDRRRNNREMTNEEKAEFYAELKWYAQSKGYKDAWAAHKYREKTGVWPNHPPIRYAEPKPPSEATRNWIISRQIAWSKRKEAA